MRTLFDDLRLSNNLFDAWRHVKRSALNSKNNVIRGKAAEFEHLHQRHIKRIQSHLKDGKFVFDAVEGVLKDKKARESVGKDPRPITIGTIKNRIVQRALLQVLQPRGIVDPSDPNSKYLPKNDPRLGALNAVNRSRFGVGGLMSPYGGVQPAIRLVMESMENGATHFFQSDIKAFFTKIPTSEIKKIIVHETKDEKLGSIFSAALEVNLSNKEELLGYARLFPSGGIGVAQGSSLSAFAGNVLLFDLDHELNKMGVSVVRYIDDIFMLSDSETRLNAAIEHAGNRLKGYGLSLYEPVAGSDKAAKGLCRNGFNFLGCTIQPSRCVPSKNSVDSIVTDVRETLSRSKKAIAAIAAGEDNFDPTNARSAVLDRVGRKLFGWQKSFAFSTDGQSFRHLDSQVANYVHSYEQEVGRIISKLSVPTRMRALGIPSTEKLFENDQQRARSSFSTAVLPRPHCPTQPKRAVG